MQSAAMSVQSALFHVAYTALSVVGYTDPVNRFVTAATLSFATAVVLGYVSVTLLGRPTMRLVCRTYSGVHDD